MPDELGKRDTDAEAPSAAPLPDAPKRITNAQTVCNERNQKGKLCNGFLKQIGTAGQPATAHLRGDDVLFHCQMCRTIYVGPPFGHLRDPKKQKRAVQTELAAVLEAAGGTLPAFTRSERGTLVPVGEAPRHPGGVKTPQPLATGTPASDKPEPSNPES